jgi:hypothetical protein
MDSVKIIYHEKGKMKEKISFTPADSFEEALERFYRVKGGREKVEVISVQDFDRVKNKEVGKKRTDIDTIYPA